LVPEPIAQAPPKAPVSTGAFSFSVDADTASRAKLR
jgi:hypothetical protein